jgi:hypothetical protein
MVIVHCNPFYFCATILLNEWTKATYMIVYI